MSASAAYANAAALASALAAASTKDLAPLFERLAEELGLLISSGAITRHLHSYLEMARANGPIPIEDGKQGEIVLYEDGHIFISIATYEKPAEVLHTHPVRGVLRVLAGASFEVCRYRLPVNWNVLDPDRDAQLAAVDSTQVGEGDSVWIDGSSEVSWFGYSSEVVVLKCIVALDAVQNWAFSRDGERLLDAECAQSRLDALLLGVDVLAQCACPESLLPLIALSRHPVYFVRWRAMRAASRLSPTVGRLLLNDALHDVHRSIRSAAARSLRMQEEASHGAHH